MYIIEGEREFLIKMEGMCRRVSKRKARYKLSFPYKILTWYLPELAVSTWFTSPTPNAPARHSLTRFRDSLPFHGSATTFVLYERHTGHCNAYADKYNYSSLDMKNSRCHNTGRGLVHSVLDYSGHLTPTPFSDCNRSSFLATNRHTVSSPISCNQHMLTGLPSCLQKLRWSYV